MNESINKGGESGRAEDAKTVFAAANYRANCLRFSSKISQITLTIRNKLQDDWTRSSQRWLNLN
jgi:hypothetical protein